MLEQAARWRTAAMTIDLSAASDVRKLSAMEQACLRLVARRFSSKQIAAELGIAKTSVDTYCDRARAKLAATDRYEAARLLEAELGPAFPTPQLRSSAQPAAAELAFSTRRKLALAVAVLVAFATLLAGLRAVDVMRPPYKMPPLSPHDAALARAHVQ
jgi:DNA-binding CsgD family transcriptional regulator